jgi:hypothetical protein
MLQIIGVSVGGLSEPWPTVVPERYERVTVVILMHPI